MPVESAAMAPPPPLARPPFAPRFPARSLRRGRFRRPFRPAIWALALCALTAAPACSPTDAGAPAAGSAGERPAGQPRLLGDGVEIAAVVSRAAFEREILGFGMPGYHLVVWDEGKAADAALFQVRASDRAVLDALEALGAEPGDALGMDTWEERGDAGSAAPDRVIAGPPVEILVRVPGRDRPLRLEEILEDPGGRGFEMRFGGHRENIPHWHSGCVACLYSCPGSKVGNAAYTVRDYERGTTRFRVKNGVLPPDGTEVTLILRMSPESSAARAEPEGPT